MRAHPRRFTIFFVRKGALILALLGLASACAGRQSDLRTKNQTLATELEDLREAARRDRARMRDLELELAKRQAAPRAQEPAVVVSPVLPVEIREPEPLESAEALPEDYQIVGEDEEGVQIVYVGEATSDKSSRVEVEKHDLTGDDPIDDDLAGPSSLRLEPVPVPAPVPATTDRLAVTKSVPSIDTQLRQARVAAVRTPTRRFGDPRAEYQRFYDALRAGNHSYAVTGFKNFIERFPGHDYADNAQYWLGEAYYDQKRFKPAAIEFRKVIDNHPGGNKVPDALLKLAFCNMKLGDSKGARELLQQVVRQYPKSNPAAIAGQKLKELGE